MASKYLWVYDMSLSLELLRVCRLLKASCLLLRLLELCAAAFKQRVKLEI